MPHVSKLFVSVAALVTGVASANVNPDVESTVTELAKCSGHYSIMSKIAAKEAREEYRTISNDFIRSAKRGAADAGITMNLDRVRNTGANESFGMNERSERDALKQRSDSCMAFAKQSKVPVDGIVRAAI